MKNENVLFMACGDMNARTNDNKKSTTCGCKQLVCICI